MHHLAICCTGFLLFQVTASWAQQTETRVHTGIPQDWTQHQLVFSRASLARDSTLMDVEPRIVHQIIQRWGYSDLRPFGDTNSAGVENSVASTLASASHRDWNVSLGTGHIVPSMFPAKYSFDPGAPPDCTNDFVVFALGTQGATGGQANLIGINNLYSGIGGICGAATTVDFAYNVTTITGGRVATSPVISLDGKKIAFVETTPTAAVFHVLTWNPGQGTIQGAAVPNMTSLNFVANGSTRSSPWVDYNSDTAYVGANDGRVYKITGVFKGTPTLAGAPWPVPLSVSPTYLLSPPVLDVGRGLLMVGSGNGNLYSIDVSSGMVTSLSIGQGLNRGILTPPIVDVTNGTTFAVSSDDGTSAVLVEVDTSTLTQLAKASIGIGSASGTSVRLHQPAFDNNYFTDPSTGVIRLCGTGTGTDISPWQYAFGFNGRLMNTTPVFSQQLVSSTTATCTPWTEFYNPNINGGTDFFFFGLTADCTGIGTSGCVLERVSDTQLVTFDLPNGPSGVVVDNYSTAPQASSIYVTDEHSPNTAYKLTQDGLQ